MMKSPLHYFNRMVTEKKVHPPTNELKLLTEPTTHPNCYSFIIFRSNEEPKPPSWDTYFLYDDTELSEEEITEFGEVFEDLLQTEFSATIQHVENEWGRATLVDVPFEGLAQQAEHMGILMTMEADYTQVSHLSSCNNSNDTLTKGYPALWGGFKAPHHNYPNYRGKTIHFDLLQKPLCSYFPTCHTVETEGSGTDSVGNCTLKHITDKIFNFGLK